MAVADGKSCGNGMTLGLVPARGGSKGVPGKNIRPVHGKPLIAYAIECGLACPGIDSVIVSTDSMQIAKIAKKCGADVPFLRPEKLADDTAPMLPVMQHAILETERYYGEEVKTLVLLDPTAPLRTEADISGALAMLEQLDCDAVISGNRAHRSPYFNMVVPDGDFIRLALSAGVSVGRRQDSPPVYDLNTVVWVYSRDAILVEKARIPRRTKLFEVPAERSVDLDTELDFVVLDALMAQQSASDKGE